jgi:Restriction endonuclease
LKTTVRSRQLVVLAEGESVSAQSNARGHLFEQFIANLLHLYGYEAPDRRRLNVTSAGIELDVTATHQMTNGSMVAECKCYSSNVPADALTSFYGKLASARLEAAGDLFGYFIAVPGLTAEADEQARKIEKRDQHFRVLTSRDILQYLEQHSEIPTQTTLGTTFRLDGSFSDDALVIDQTGLYVAALELDQTTRLATRVLVFPCKGDAVPETVLSLLAETRFAGGRPCEAATPRSSTVVNTHAGALPETVVEVTGSTSDFEYHLPASPRFFVGRNPHVKRLNEALASAVQRTGRSQVLVFNAQSGWGKSSLALRLSKLTHQQGGVAVCIDCRTAQHAPFVGAAVHRALKKAEAAGLLTPPAGASFASVASILETLRETSFSSRAPLCIFFDQFENVFRNDPLTREFRDLALGVAELHAPLILGFAWKTDLVGFTETHPYQMRDDIRSRSVILALEPFSAAEIGKLITRLQHACNQKLVRDLRERLREYSQGLPWLFKKLASHIQRELSSGVTQEQLLAEVLNIQSLFDTDLRGLMPREVEALKALARSAPVLATDAVESQGQPVVQTLLDQRLLVPVGERLDVYWDTFRDYLITGSVPIQDSYILRQTPNQVTKLLKHIRDSGWTTTAEGAATSLSTSRFVVFNMARDLRQLGILAPTEGALRVVDEIAQAYDPPAVLRARTAAQLKRHRAFSLLVGMALPGAAVSIADFTLALRKEYPAVDAQPKTWTTYAAAFLYWFRYAGLASLERDLAYPGREQSLEANLFKLDRAPRRKDLVIFPRAAPGPVIEFVDALSRGVRPRLRRKMAEADAVLLGLAGGDPRSGFSLTDTGRALTSAASQEERRGILRAALARHEAFGIAARLIALDPGASPTAIGNAVSQHYGVQWKAGTAVHAGKFLRAWLRQIGVKTRMRPGNHGPTGPSA